MVLDNFLNFIFGWILALGKPWSLIVISFILTLLVNLAIKFLSDQNAMKKLKEESQFFKNEMKNLKDEPQKLLEMQKKAMENSLNYMKHSMKPTLFTLIPLLIIFSWLGKKFPAGETLINLPFSLPLIGSSIGWLGTYIISSIIFSLIIRKILKLH